jgi:hypothetical protein
VHEDDIYLKLFMFLAWAGSNKKTLQLPPCVFKQRLLTCLCSNTQGEMNMSKAKSTPMTPSAAARIQGGQAKANGGQVAKGSFAARAQSAAAKNSQS